MDPEARGSLALGGNVGVRTDGYGEYGGRGCAGGDETAETSRQRAPGRAASPLPGEQRPFLRGFGVHSRGQRLVAKTEENGPCAQARVWGGKARVISGSRSKDIGAEVRNKDYEINKTYVF